jgi:hypothetical protein
MKKNILYTMLFAAATFAFVSCSDEESEGRSRITYYPTIELEGANPLVVAKGSTYKDPGYVSVMGGQDVSDKVIITGLPDTNVSGDYTVKYTTAKNSDGFDATATRRVIVADQADAVEGLYMVSADSYRLRSGAKVAYGASYPIVVLNEGDGTYFVDDMLGGWYYYRAGYGVNYAMASYISVAADGTVSLLESEVPGWGDSHDDFTGSFDAATGTFTMTTVYAGMDFVQTWVKQTIE